MWCMSISETNKVQVLDSGILRIPKDLVTADIAKGIQKRGAVMCDTSQCQWYHNAVCLDEFECYCCV
jgi:hypothetical protein